MAEASGAVEPTGKLVGGDLTQIIPLAVAVRTTRGLPWPGPPLLVLATEHPPSARVVLRVWF